jgi:hypothetical protein
VRTALQRPHSYTNARRLKLIPGLSLVTFAALIPTNMYDAVHASQMLILLSALIMIHESQREFADSNA